MYTVFIRATIARLYIVLGILFVLIFLLGYFVLDDVTNLLLAISSSLLIIIGAIALKSPYASFDEKQLIVYNFFGKIRVKYTFSDKTEITVRHNNIYFRGEKVKISASFVNRAEWKRLIHFYTIDAELMDELNE